MASWGEMRESEVLHTNYMLVVLAQIVLLLCLFSSDILHYLLFALPQEC